MSRLQWVSQWRIEEETEKSALRYGWKYKVTSGWCYMHAATIEEAKVKLHLEISQEKYRYMIRLLDCPSCGIPFSKHGTGSRSYTNCLENLAIDLKNNKITKCSSCGLKERQDGGWAYCPWCGGVKTN